MIFEQIYVHIFDLDEIFTFLQIDEQLKLTQEEINNVTSLVFIKQIVFVVKTLFPKKIPGIGSSVGEFC